MSKRIMPMTSRATAETVVFTTGTGTSAIWGKTTVTTLSRSSRRRNRSVMTALGDEPNPREHLQTADGLCEGFRCFRERLDHKIFLFYRNVSRFFRKNHL